MRDDELRHWHGVPSKLEDPPACCASTFRQIATRRDEVARHRQDEAVHAERRRVVLAALTEVERYADALASVLVSDQAELATKVMNHVVEAIQSAGCICPMVDITELGSPFPRSTRGGDPRCGLHGVRQAVRS